MTQEPSTSPSDDAAIEAAEVSTGTWKRIERLELENGVVLRIKPVAPLILRDASARVPVPQVPTYYNSDLGREEPNPNHPDYLQALREYGTKTDTAALTVGLIIGTEIESVPADMYRPEQDGWIDDIEAAAEYADVTFNIHREGKGRYLDWLRLYAIPSEVDIFKITMAVTKGSLLSEAEVQSAAESFRRVFGGAVDMGSRPAEAPVERAVVPSDPAGDDI